MLNEISAGAIIFRSESGEVLFLILHYKEGHWGASKGHVETGESLKQTALREIREETGITDISWIARFKAEDHYVYQKHGQPSSKTVTFFLAETHTAEVRLSDEHLDYAWLPYSECYAKVTYETEKQVWQSAHDYMWKMKLI